jgi:hypothetical protein
LRRTPEKLPREATNRRAMAHLHTILSYLRTYVYYAVGGLIIAACGRILGYVFNAQSCPLLARTACASSYEQCVRAASSSPCGGGSPHPQSEPMRDGDIAADRQAAGVAFWPRAQHQITCRIGLGNGMGSPVEKANKL